MLDYVIDCIKTNKKVSGKKISSWKNSNPNGLELAYLAAYNIERPKCKVCENDTAFISIKEGYRKYCSRVCFRSELSKRNSNNNHKLIETKSLKIKKRNEQNKDLIVNDYKNNLISMKDLSKKFDIPLCSIRNIIGENIDFNRQRKVLKKNLERKFSSINSSLSDINSCQLKINNEHYSAKDFANDLECSKNYVSVKLRNKVKWNTQKSSQEKKIHDLLDSYNIDYIKNDRKQIAPKELDIFIPKYNLAIEVNGLYYHSFKEKNYHLNKTKSFSGRLIHFTDKQIDEEFNKVKSIILSSIGKNKRIYARKCSISEIDSKTYHDFCKDNHIQGGVNASVRVGLFYNNELVAVLGIGKSRFNKKYQYELLRYCSILESNVVGGFSKLFSYFKTSYNPDSIISYCQRQLFNGSMYEKSGFTLSHQTQPGYIWSDGNTILTRYQTQMKDEDIIMKNRGFNKYHDCGQNVYVWINN